jgi:hypothetical protein
LEQDNLLLRGSVVDRLGDFKSLVEISILVMALGEVEFVLCDFGIKLRELFVDTSRVEKILAHIVAVGEKGHGPASGAELQLIAEEVDGLGRRISYFLVFGLLDELVDGLGALSVCYLVLLHF